jgi:hypothetical protein
LSSSGSSTTAESATSPRKVSENLKLRPIVCCRWSSLRTIHLDRSKASTLRPSRSTQLTCHNKPLTTFSLFQSAADVAKLSQSLSTNPAPPVVQGAVVVALSTQIHLSMCSQIPAAVPVVETSSSSFAATSNSALSPRDRPARTTKVFAHASSLTFLCSAMQWPFAAEPVVCSFQVVKRVVRRRPKGPQGEQEDATLRRSSKVMFCIMVLCFALCLMRRVEFTSKSTQTFAFACN